MLLNKISRLLIRARDSKSIVTMRTQEYIHFEVEFGRNHPHVPIEEKIPNILGASVMCEIIEDGSKIREVQDLEVSFFEAQEATTTLFTFLEQR